MVVRAHHEAALAVDAEALVRLEERGDEAPKKRRPRMQERPVEPD